jgi:iron complex transport system ATP-binding protein
MSELVAKALSLRARGATLVDRASFRLAPGELVALLGPNGAGKTSLIRASLGLVRPSSGRATLGGADTAGLAAAQRARALAYLPQQRPLAWPLGVRDLVALGRFSHGAVPARLAPADAAAVDRALAACDLETMAHRRTDTLSGGELARVHCARAFAAEAPLLIADEPTAALDPRHQLQVMALIRDFVGAGGGALVVLHDIQLAADHASRLVWMKAGRILADGAPEDTLTPERLAEVYGVQATITGRRIEILCPS